MVMAMIYAINGQYEESIDMLDDLLGMPSWSSVAYLRVDPLFEPLWDNPRFIAMLKKYE